MGVQVDYSSVGDPAAMEALAAEFLLRAESIAGIAASLSRQVDAMTFEGPAARDLRDRTHARRRQAERSAARLQEAAHMLKRSAAAAREQIHELHLAQLRAQEQEP
ncbi:MAG: hypothetical protein M3N53_00410 [Actinomycetota bacterium]|nr:hypothetical protein [Actinomycetota bacterium]